MSEEPNELLRVSVADGKYTVVQPAKGGVYAERYGDRWRELVGDGLVLSLAQELDEARTALAAAEKERKKSEQAWREVFDNSCRLEKQARAQLAQAVEALKKFDVDRIVSLAALKWCGRKERETFMEDIEYFKCNWRSLEGMKATVAEVALEAIWEQRTALASITGEAKSEKDTDNAD
jgi:multidrug resistance efflux pump